FRFECEEFPRSPTKFGSNFQPIQGWESWVNKIHLRMKRLFFMVGVYDVVQVTFKLPIHREKRIEAWYSILSRWSTVSHTIITTWGGFIFTLEDGRFSVCAPPPNPSPSPATSSNKFVGNNYTAWLWHNQNSKGNILQVLDIIKEFTWCPYIQEKNGFGNPEYFYAILE
ncbi:hypothetical protein Gorai_006160, partial [Gossypium raimondii]|nr:hypothetical protein [Gossypium raimondii]